MIKQERGFFAAPSVSSPDSLTGLVTLVGLVGERLNVKYSSSVGDLLGTNSPWTVSKTVLSTSVGEVVATHAPGMKRDFIESVDSLRSRTGCCDVGNGAICSSSGKVPSEAGKDMLQRRGGISEYMQLQSTRDSLIRSV